MENEANIKGSFINVVQGIGENSTVNITQILGKSYEYNDFLDKLKTKQELFDSLPEDNTERRLQLSAEINQLKDYVEQFKRDVMQLAETFDKLEINTERLKQARSYFEKGDIGEARALLNDDNERIESEEKILWAKRDYYQKKIEPKLIEKAEERLIQAVLNKSDYTNQNWFADTCQYFERSIESYPKKDNVFIYASFLQDHNQFRQAQKYYSQFLNDFSAQITADEYAAALNNLAILHQAQNNFDEALKEYGEALQIYRQLAETNPQTYSPFVATALNNFAGLHVAKNEFEKVLEKAEESTKIYRELAIKNFQAYFPNLANNLCNLSWFYQDMIPNREKSIEYAIETMMILFPYIENVPFTQKYYVKALNVLRKWQLTDEEISHKIEEKMTENEQH